MPDIIQTLSDFGGYALSVQRRNRKPEDSSFGVTSTPTVTALTLTKGATAIEVAVSDDAYLSSSLRSAVTDGRTSHAPDPGPPSLVARPSSPPRYAKRRLLRH